MFFSQWDSHGIISLAGHLNLGSNPLLRQPRLSDGMRRPVSLGMRYVPNNRRARSTRERRPAVKKISTVATNRSEVFKEHKLTIGLDLGDRSSHYCILDEAGEVILEHNFP